MLLKNNVKVESSVKPIKAHSQRHKVTIVECFRIVLCWVRGAARAHRRASLSAKSRVWSKFDILDKGHAEWETWRRGCARRVFGICSRAARCASCMMKPLSRCWLTPQRVSASSTLAYHYRHFDVIFQRAAANLQSALSHEQPSQQIVQRRVR